MMVDTQSIYLLPSSHELLAAGPHEMRVHGNDLQGNKDPPLVEEPPLKHRMKALYVTGSRI